MRQRLGAQGFVFGFNTIRFFARHAITGKKTAHASEQDRPDLAERREAWFEEQLDLDPDRLIFIDETWASNQHGSATVDVGAANG